MNINLQKACRTIANYYDAENLISEYFSENRIVERLNKRCCEEELPEWDNQLSHNFTVTFCGEEEIDLLSKGYQRKWRVTLPISILDPSQIDSAIETYIAQKVKSKKYQEKLELFLEEKKKEFEAVEGIIA